MTFHPKKGQWLRAAEDCFPLELGKTGLPERRRYCRAGTGASLSTETKPKTARALTSEEPAHGTTQETSGAPGIINFSSFAPGKSALPQLLLDGPVANIPVRKGGRGESPEPLISAEAAKQRHTSASAAMAGHTSGTSNLESPWIETKQQANLTASRTPEGSPGGDSHNPIKESHVLTTPQGFSASAHSQLAASGAGSVNPISASHHQPSGLDPLQNILDCIEMVRFSRSAAAQDPWLAMIGEMDHLCEIQRQLEEVRHARNAH